MNPLYDQLYGRHAGSPRPFLILPDGGTISYDAFLRLAARYANLLTARGLVAGDRLAMQVPKSAEALAVTAAATAAGVVFLPLNTGYTPAEVDYFVGNSGARLLLADPVGAAALAPVAARHGAGLMTLGAAGDGSFAEAAAGMEDSFAPVDRGEDDLAAFLYTSGTTGRSKGAMLTQGNLLSNARVLAEQWRFTEADCLLHALPIFHTHGLFVATGCCLVAGASMILLPKFDPAEVLRLLPQATTMMGVPTFYTRLLDSPGFDRDAAAHMRLFTSGSAPLLAETHRAFTARTGQAHPRTLRHDRDQHEHLEPLRGRTAAGHGRVSAAGGGAEDLRCRGWRSAAGRDRRHRGARPERLQGLLADAREDRRGTARRRLLHHRRSGPDRRGRLCPYRRAGQGSGDLGRVQHLSDRGRDAAGCRRPACWKAR